MERLKLLVCHLFLQSVATLCWGQLPPFHPRTRHRDGWVSSPTAGKHNGFRVPMNPNGHIRAWGRMGSIPVSIPGKFPSPPRPIPRFSSKPRLPQRPPRRHPPHHRGQQSPWAPSPLETPLVAPVPPEVMEVLPGAISKVMEAYSQRRSGEVEGRHPIRKTTPSTEPPVIWFPNQQEDCQVRDLFFL